MSSYSVGDIYKACIRYEDDLTKSKVRPVLIIDVVDDIPTVVTITEITSIVPHIPPKYHDRFKIRIKKWTEAGLDKPSFAKIHKIHELPVEALFEYVGHLDYYDLLNIILAINE